MPRALLVVSSFNPVMLADMQRARMLAWELPKLGWSVEVLTPRASEVRQDAIEPDPGSFFPPGLPVHEVGSLWRHAFEMLGSHTSAWRTLWPMYRRGCRLLRSGGYDLVYISTATSVYFMLGAWWLRRFGVPYVLDFHDPWVRDREPSDSFLKLKNWAVDRIAIIFERRSVRTAAGLIAVSPHYIEKLRERYARMNPPWLAKECNAVIPFSAHPGDLLAALPSVNKRPDAPSPFLTLVYVGVGGALMARSFDLICRTLAALRRDIHPHAERVRIRLLGTTYGWSEGMPKALEGIATRHGLGDLVEELPQRIAYRESLIELLRADGALVLGVDDQGYMPSKLFSYALSGKPLLAALRRDSPAFQALTDSPALGYALWFDDTESISEFDARRIVAAFLEEAARRQSIDRRDALEPYLSPTMARRHAELFNACV